MLTMAMLDDLLVPGEFIQVEHAMDENVLTLLDVWKTEAEDES
jgi:hypothetical protein